jgi:hypothetical protein
MSSQLVLYAVRNKEGKWFRNKGFSYDGSGTGKKSWVDDLKSAKIYPRIGQAKSRCTFFSKAYPQYGTPDLIELHVTEVKVVDQTKRVEKAIMADKKRKAKQEAKYKQWRLDQAKKELESAQEKLKNLQNS